MATQSRTYKTKIPKWEKETLQTLLAKQRIKKDIALATLLFHSTKATKVAGDK